MVSDGFQGPRKLHRRRLVSRKLVDLFAKSRGAGKVDMKGSKVSETMSLRRFLPLFTKSRTNFLDHPPRNIFGRNMTNRDGFHCSKFDEVVREVAWYEDK